VTSYRIQPLKRSAEVALMEFLNRDRIGNYYILYDLHYLRDRIQVWVASDASGVQACMMEYDGRIIHVRGSPDCVLELLSMSDLSEPMLNIEPRHLAAVSERFEPVEPADRRTNGLITTFWTLKATSKSFRPLIRHDVQELNQTHISDVMSLMELEPQRVQELVRSAGFGAFDRGRLVSCAFSPNTFEDMAIIRGVFTAAEERNKGYSSSVCSALVQKLLGQGKDVILFVSKDNPAAVKVYSRIGFEDTGRVSLAFKARQKTAN
jgi:RimJ/RimL family protein N-acetyltransferase